MHSVRFAHTRTLLLVTAAVTTITFAGACGGKHGPSKIDSLKIDETVNLPGLEGPVDVVRDEYGRPHIYASSIHDLAEVTGWVHAEDRFVQMDLQRRIASARLAELVGAALPSAVDFDREFHAIGLHRAAQKIYDSLPAGSDAKIAMDAYAVGVNAKLAAFGTTSPAPEYTVFQYPFEQTPPWTPVDSLSVARLLAFQLDWGGDEEIAFADELATASAVFTTGALAGFVDDTYLHFKPAEDITIVNPPAAFAAPAPALPTTSSIPRATLSRARQLHDKLAASPLAKLVFRDNGFGSNDWVVSGAKTSSGHPILCNDPHLSLSAPPVWYELHWSTVKYGGDLDVTGVSFPGVPAIILGGNGHVAWGVTNVGPDATDVYVEHYSLGTGSNGADQVMWDADGTGAGAPAYVDLVKDTAHLIVRGSGGATTDVLDTIWLVPQRNGVIVPGSLVVDTAQSMVTGTALSWAWTGFYATTEVNTFFGLAHAKNAADVIAADQLFDAPPQNMVYADSAGNIGYIAGGWYPVRGDNDGDLHTDPPFLPMPGYDGAHEGIGRLSASQVPQEQNPARGWLASANQDPIGTNGDGDVLNDAVYLGALDWDIGFRSARIAAALTNLQDITVGEMTQLQSDHKSNLAVRLVPFLIESIVNTHPQQATMLSAWKDRGYRADSGVGDAVPADEVDNAAATSLFNAWLTSARVKAFQDEELHAGVGLDQFIAANLMIHLLEHPTDAATYDATTGESALWDDITTPAVETRDQIFQSAMDEALDFLASPAGFSSSDPNDWRWGLLHTVNFARQSGLTPFDIPEGTDPNYPKGYPRHSDEFNVDVGNFGLADKNFTYGAGASMREVIDLRPGRMRIYNQLPGGASADPQSPHYADRAEEYSKNITRETWYRESDVASHGKSRVRFLAP